MWKAKKTETFLYLILGLYIATPSKINIFYSLISYLVKNGSRTMVEMGLFLRLFVSIIGAIIVISACMEIFNKVMHNEFA